jgi:drug/metabolite transporter (DMT)-like permease
LVAIALARPALLRVSPGALWRLALLGIAGMSLSNYTYYLTLSLIPVAMAAILLYMTPLFVLAGGVLSLYWLPRMANASNPAELRKLLRRAFYNVVVPSALALAVLALLASSALRVLFTDQFELPFHVSVLILAGDAVRVLAWLFLFSLYACKATRLIAVGELLSLPLFASSLLLLGDSMTPTKIGAMWLATYTIYAGFNAYAIARVMRSPGTRHPKAT